MKAFAVVILKKKRSPKVRAVFRTYDEAYRYVLDQRMYNKELWGSRLTIRKTIFIENYE